MRGREGFASRVLVLAAIFVLVLCGVWWVRDRQMTKQVQGYLAQCHPLVEQFKEDWHRAESTDIREIEDAIKPMDETRAAFVALDPPGPAREFHTQMAYAMDAGIELVLAFRALGPEGDLDDKWRTVSVTSKAAADLSKELMRRYPLPATD